MSREFSVEPTPALKNIYEKIISQQHGKGRITDLLLLGQDLLEANKMEGALYCEPHYFKTIYNFERRKCMRSGSPEYLCLITICKRANISKWDREHVMESLEQLLLGSLRKGDVFCRWNPSQILVLLPGIGGKYLQLVENRIQERFENVINPKKFGIQMNFQPITAINPFTT